MLRIHVQLTAEGLIYLTFEEICARLANNDPNLTSLNLSNQELGFEEIKKLALALQSNYTLLELDLSDNQIAYGMEYLVQTLIEESKTRLIKLNLRGNEDFYFSSLNSESFYNLSRVIELNTTLHSLDISGCRPGLEIIDKIAQALRLNSTLTWLNLSGNYLGTEEFQAIGQALKSNRTLTYLGLSFLVGNESEIEYENLDENMFTSFGTEDEDGIGSGDYYNLIGKEGMISLAEALTQNTSLMYLDISHYRPTIEGMNILIQALNFNMSLIELKHSFRVGTRIWTEIDQLLHPDAVRNRWNRFSSLQQRVSRQIKEMKKEGKYLDLSSLPLLVKEMNQL